MALQVEETSAQQEKATGLEVINVTAQKRPEDAQKTPISLNA